jgi:hypothetical protein
MKGAMDQSFFLHQLNPREKIGVGSFKILPSKLSQTVGGGHFFSFAITFGELPKFKICQTNYLKLLQLL